MADAEVILDEREGGKKRERKTIGKLSRGQEEREAPRGANARPRCVVCEVMKNGVKSAAVGNWELEETMIWR